MTKKNRPKGLKYIKKPKALNVKNAHYVESDVFNTLDDITIVTIDSEYIPGMYTTYQAYIPSENVKLLSINQNLYKRYPKRKSTIDNLKSEFLKEKDSCNLVIYQDLDNVSNDNLNNALYDYYTSKGKKMPKMFLLLMFYTVKDLYCTFGYITCKNAFLNEKKGKSSSSNIYKLRNLKGNIVTNDARFVIFDLYGLVNFSSLQELANSVGISMPDKNALDRYKKLMSFPLLTKNKELRMQYLKYSMQDTIILYQIWTKRIEQHNNLLVEAFDFSDKYLFKKTKFPSTIGRLVATSFENFLYNTAKLKGIEYTFKAAVFKIGFLDYKHPKYMDNRDERHHLYTQLNDDISSIENRTSAIDKHCTSYVYIFNAFNMASIPYLLSHDKKTTLLTSAMVTGGRCNNERYQETHLNNLLDLDFDSCYGKSLRDLNYPIGHPRMYAPSVNKKGMSLKEFLKKHEYSLVHGLYKIIVSGKLTFKQDLIYSKLLTEARVAYYQNNPEQWTSTEDYLDTDHVLLKSEIENGVITGDILDIIKKVATAQEQSELFELEVKSAIFWEKEYYIGSLKVWSEKVLQSPLDEAPIPYWTTIPLGEYINPLLDMRRLLKNRASEEINLAIKQELNSKQICVKLAINTLYGVLSSRFFSTSNTVIGDNITAKPRAQIWLASKALGGIQSITDGFAYQPSKVPYFKGTNVSFNKPGLNAFSSYYKILKNRNIGFKEHLDYSWSNIFKNSFKEFNFDCLNKETKNAINLFWKPYNLAITFDIEHKTNNTAYRGSFWGKAHYALETIYSQRVYKLRGYKEYNKKNGVRSPLYVFLDHLIDGNNAFPSNFTYDKTEPLSIKDWKAAYKKDHNYSDVPGDFLTSYDHELKLQPNHMPSNTLKAYKKKKRYRNKKNRNSYQIDHNNSNISDMLKHMIDNYID